MAAPLPHNHIGSTAAPLARAVFVQADSPGQLVRLLERLRRQTPALSPLWWVTNPMPPQGFRVLVTTPVVALVDLVDLVDLVATAPTTLLTEDAESQVAAQFSLTLPAPVFCLTIRPEGWKYRRWERGAEVEGVEVESGEAAAGRVWWQRLPGVPQPPAPWRAAGKALGLPVARLDDAPPLARGADIVPYRTVKGLDQRGLLVERKNCWYALTLGEG